MKAWKDTTGYSHGERGKIEPGSWRIECGEVQIVVTRHIYYPGQWVARSESCGLLLQPLNIPGDSSAETAQDAALSLVRRRLRTLQDDYDTMLNLKEGDDEKDE